MTANNLTEQDEIAGEQTSTTHAQAETSGAQTELAVHEKRDQGATVEDYTATLARTSETTSIQSAEIESLARQLGATHRQQVESHQKLYGCDIEEAQLQVSAPAMPVLQKHILDKAAHEVGWDEINALAHTDAALALQRISSIRHSARLELQSGHRSAAAVMPAELRTPWEQERFLAIHDELEAEWNPRSGIERTLLQQAAQAQSLYLHWLGVMSERSHLDCDEPSSPKRHYKAPRLSDVECIEQAAAMADRFQKAFLRCIRALADQRKVSVVVQNAGQVNIGNRQVNVAQEQEGPKC